MPEMLPHRISRLIVQDVDRQQTHVENILQLVHKVYRISGPLFPFRVMFRKRKYFSAPAFNEKWYSTPAGVAVKYIQLKLLVPPKEKMTTGRLPSGRRHHCTIPKFDLTNKLCRIIPWKKN